ncbi:hypothetical protein Tco_0770351 [Tanacetum coccineum]|uniref:Uncharacterized protein n=1 Tax=Tanacetum coccineum TaxID=301880 RepID=A0ABQ4ZFA2_9ASTR
MRPDVATLFAIFLIQLHKPYNSLLYVAGLSPTWKGLGHVPLMKGPGGNVPPWLNSFVRSIPSGANIIERNSTRLEDVPLKTPAMENAEDCLPKGNRC